MSADDPRTTPDEGRRQASTVLLNVSECPTCGKVLLHSRLREQDGKLIVVCEHGHPWYTAGFRSAIGEPDRFDLGGPAPVKHERPVAMCVFCGARANSREHAIPAWMSKRLGIKEYLPGDNFGGRITLRKQPISFASFRARIFCSDCNSHFKHLEDAVIPLLVPMATGRVLSVNSASQTLLALWAAKTAVALMVATAPEHQKTIPLEHRTSIRVDHRPHDAVWVSFVSWRGNTVFSTAEGGVTPKVPGVERVPYDVYGSVFAFRRLAFSVIGFIDDLDKRDVIDREAPAIQQFWPIKNRMVHWPPTAPPIHELGHLLAFVPLRRAEV